MDFLVLPDNVSSHMPVPDLGGPDFDNKGFLGYNQRSGWNVKAILAGDVLGARNDWEDYWPRVVEDFLPEEVPEGETRISIDIGHFIQTWILFGILQEALRRPILRHEVSVPATTAHLDADGKLISRKSITVRRLFGEFTKLQDALRVDSEWARRLFRCLSQAAWILTSLDNFWAPTRVCFVPMTVHMGLAVLVQTCLDRCFIFCDEPLDPDDYYIARCGPFKEKLLTQKGWCPNMIHRLEKCFQLEGLYFASLLPELGRSEAHDNCTANVRIAFNIDPANYVVQHVSKFCACHDHSCDHTRPECPCPLISAPHHELELCLEDGGFPLIRLSSDGNKLVPYEPSMTYTAISHVWSDGRGGSTNALPLCQLQLLDLYVTASTPGDYNEEDHLFWIDTVCVPVKEPLRHRAIMRMEPVYAEATRVLVLSDEFTMHDLPLCIDQSLLMICRSKWMTRLWTMQGAALVKELVFQFANGSLPYRRLRDLVMSHGLHESDESQRIARCAVSELDNVVGMLKPESIATTGGFPLVNFWAGLLHRTSSRPLDMTICGSILLGTDLERLLLASDEEKMKTFWTCQKIPASILWVPGPRLETEGFRWAPSNLLDPVTAATPADMDSPVADLIEAGLIVRDVKALLLQKLVAPEDGEVGIQFGFPEKDQKYIITKGSWFNHGIHDELDNIWSEQLVLLLPEFPSDRTFQSAALILPTANAPRGTNTSTDDVDAFTMPARYVACVLVHMAGGRDHDYMSRQLDGYDTDMAVLQYKDLKYLNVGDALSVPASRSWCIS